MGYGDLKYWEWQIDKIEKKFRQVGELSSGEVEDLFKYVTCVFGTLDSVRSLLGAYHVD